ncbi:MAG TPA: hypothetical protein VGB26_08950 [Nitrospiria bacterium]|jgi:hypothetical protein
MRKKVEILFMGTLILLTTGLLVTHFSMAQQNDSENSPDGFLYLNQKGRFQ